MLDHRLVCLYLDDSGQQSNGAFFVIAGVAISTNRSVVASALRNAEIASGKQLRDWHRTNPARRIAYLSAACAIPTLRGHIFYKVHTPCNTDHMQLRGDAVQDAIAKFAHTNQRAIYYEGLTRANRESLEGRLRRRGLKCEVRNGRWDKIPEVRLADALAGMIAKTRFSTDGPLYAHLVCNWFVQL